MNRIKEKKVALFLNGDIPPKSVINKYKIQKFYKIASDGGANYLAELGITPDIIIGDLDSVSRKTLSYFRKKNVTILQIFEQETTDFEKSLMYIIQNGLDNVIIFGGISARPDHTINNFSVMRRYHPVLNLRMIDKELEIFFVNGKINFKAKKGDIVSFLGMPFAAGVTTKGLEFSLNEEELEFGVREGTLNRAKGGNVSVKFDDGDLLLFKKH